MSDYVLEFKVRNGRIKRAIQERGYRSVNALCKQHGIDASTVGQILNLKLPPMLQSGQWRQIAVDLAEALDLTPEDLFAQSQRTLKVRSNSGERYITEDQVHRLAAEDRELRWKLLGSGDPAELVDNDQEFSVTEFIKSQDTPRHNMGLTDRELDAIRLAFDEDRTLEEIGQSTDVGRERARQILARALRKLRHPSNREAFNKFSPILATISEEWAKKRAQEEAEKAAKGEAMRAKLREAGDNDSVEEVVRVATIGPAKRVQPSTTPWIHVPGDGRGPRRVYVDGELQQRVIYADVRQGFIRQLAEPITLNHRTGRSHFRKIRGVVTVDFF